MAIGRSRSFRVTDFGTNRKLIYDFLLVINTNLPPILHCFQDMADYMSQIFASDRVLLHFNALAGGDSCEYRHKWYTAGN